MNIALLVVAAANLQGHAGTGTIEGAHAAITSALGPVVGVLFAVGLLASGLASSSVGAYAGSEVMAGLLKVRVPLLVRRLVTLLPALVLLALGTPPTATLVISQVVLSFGIPFAVVPLIRLNSDPAVMGEYVAGRSLRIAGWASATVVIALNVVLLGLTFARHGLRATMRRDRLRSATAVRARSGDGGNRTPVHCWRTTSSPGAACVCRSTRPRPLPQAGYGRQAQSR